MSDAADPLMSAVEDTIASNPRQVEDWLANRPGAWGFLAGQGILAYQNRIGQRLIETQRRQLWSVLWTALEQQKRLRPPS
ncbi:MAG TPA: hypothetical protein VNG11_03185 [Chloroflexota bacterium]|nr:hypothetical protein [Chloroflexota bacterium]